MSPIAPCPHGDRCAGCPFLDVEQPEQLRRKQARVAAAFAPYDDLRSVSIAEVAAATPAVGYRPRAKWTAGAGASLGLFAKGGGFEVVDVPGCLVVRPAVRDAGDALRAVLREPPSGVGDWWATSDDGGALLAVDVREVTEGERSSVLVTLVLDRDRAVSDEELRVVADAIVRREPRIAGVAASSRAKRSPQVLGQGTRVVHGLREARDDASGVPVLATYGSFVQAHPPQAKAIVEAIARSGEIRGTRVLDVYGGSGAIGLALARAGASVDLVESFPPAASAAERAASAMGVALRALTGDAAAVLASLVSRRASYDLAVANPPRRGLSPEVRRALAALRPSRLAYVSCEPTTLARDLDHLARLGFSATEARPFDLMPMTPEVESLVLLAPAPTPPPKVLHEDDDVLALAIAGHDPILPARFVPLFRLDAGTSGVALLAKTPAAADAWRPAIERASTTWIALAKGITSKKGSIARPLRDRRGSIDAKTRYRRVDVAGGQSLVDAWPDRPSAAQLRRHLAGIGHPVLGDPRGDAASNRHLEERHGLDRPFVHCARVELVHPRTGAPLALEAPLAGDLEAVLTSLRRAGRAEESPTRSSDLG